MGPPESREEASSEFHVDIRALLTTCRRRRAESTRAARNKVLLTVPEPGRVPRCLRANLEAGLTWEREMCSDRRERLSNQRSAFA